MFEDESLKILYPVEVLDCLVEVSTGGTLYWIIIFDSHANVISRGHHILEGVNLHPRGVFYTKRGLLIPTKSLIVSIMCVF
jgi:hypothetical protein